VRLIKIGKAGRIFPRRFNNYYPTRTRFMVFPWAQMPASSGTVRMSSSRRPAGKTGSPRAGMRFWKPPAKIKTAKPATFPLQINAGTAMGEATTLQGWYMVMLGTGTNIFNFQTQKYPSQANPSSMRSTSIRRCTSTKSGRCPHAAAQGRTRPLLPGLPRWKHRHCW